MKIPDEMLSAFVNGELDGAERQRVERAIARDRRVAQRVAKQRANRARVSANATFDDVLRPSPPSRRDVASRLYPGSAQIIDLAQVRATHEQSARRRRSRIGPRLLIVASLAISFAGGGLFVWLRANDNLTHFQGGKLLAHGALARALDEQIVGQASIPGGVRVTSTFLTREGAYCRTFTASGAQATSSPQALPGPQPVTSLHSVSGPQTLTGLACRYHDAWQVQTLLTNAAAPALLLELNKDVSPTPISAVTEAQLRTRNWH